jgi:hypothetical protein
LTTAGLNVKTSTTARSARLRHTYATVELLTNTAIHTLAKLLGTGVLLLEQHCSKRTATMAADRLA